jgi:hypothetical protein
MRALTKHSLGQLDHLGLLSLAIESGAAGTAHLESRLALQSREQLIDALTRTGPLKRLAERAETRLGHDYP